MKAYSSSDILIRSLSQARKYPGMQDSIPYLRLLAVRSDRRCMRFIGWQEVPNKKRVALFNLIKPLGQHPEGSTITTVTARNLMRERREIGE